MVTRHPLDNSPRRLCDITDRDELRRRLVERDSRARDAWLDSLKPAPGLFQRIRNRIMGRP